MRNGRCLSTFTGLGFLSVHCFGGLSRIHVLVRMKVDWFEVQGMPVASPHSFQTARISVCSCLSVEDKILAACALAWILLCNY